MMPTQTYIDNSGGKVVNIIPKRTMRHAHNPKALKTEEKKMSNPLKSHQNTLVSHPAPKLPSASNFRRFKINELTDFIYFDRLCQNIFSKFFIAKFTKISGIMNIV
jgi:hypothetical protein